MKKIAATVLVGILGLVLFITVIVPRKKQDPSVCPANAVVAGSFTGDLGKIQMPFTGSAVYTSKYGMRVNPGNLHYGEKRLHAGADIAQTPSPSLIVSATKGKVQKVWTNGEGANIVMIDVGANTTIQYIHLASFAPGIKAGDEVWPGKPIGMEGATGNASGPHLHFQIEVSGKPVEPWAWMKQHGLGSAPSADAVSTPLTGGPRVDERPTDAGAGGANAQNVSESPSASSSSSDNLETSAHTVTLPATSAVGDEFKSNPPTSIPADFLRYYQEAGKKYGVPWQVLAGIGMAENAHGRNKGISSANAQGPMQFLPSTWAAEGVDGNGDGKKDINDPADAIYGAANYLAHNGGSKGSDGIRKAILTYNHSIEYLNSVVSYAKHYAGGKVEVGAASSSAGGCDATNADQISNVPASSAYEKAAIAAAQPQLGLPYVWGGGDQNGTTKGGFDCSGFTMYVVAQGTKKAGKELDLPHLSSDQHTTKSMATVARYPGQGQADMSKMRVGDVIIYNLASGQYRHPWNHTAIYIGNGQIIHAPVAGQNVKLAKVMDMKGEWVARRPLSTYTGGDAAAPSSSTSAVNG